MLLVLLSFVFVCCDQIFGVGQALKSELLLWPFKSSLWYWETSCSVWVIWQIICFMSFLLSNQIAHYLFFVCFCQSLSLSALPIVGQNVYFCIFLYHFNSVLLICCDYQKTVHFTIIVTLPKKKKLQRFITGLQLYFGFPIIVKVKIRKFFLSFIYHAFHINTHGI